MNESYLHSRLVNIAQNLNDDKLRHLRFAELPLDTLYLRSDDRATLRITVQQALAVLPIDYRAPLILCDLEDMAAQPAAEVLNISVPALKSRLYRGRRALRDKLSGTLERNP